MRRRLSILVVSLFAALGLATLFYARHHKQADNPQNSYEGILWVRVPHATSRPDQHPEARGPITAVRNAIFDAFLPFAQSPTFEEQAEQRTLALNPDLKPCLVSVHIVEIPNPEQTFDSAWIDHLYCVSAQGKDDEYVRCYVDSLMDEIVLSCAALSHAARDEFTSLKASFLTDKIKALRASNPQKKPDAFPTSTQSPDEDLKYWERRYPRLAAEIQRADAQFLSPSGDEPETLASKYRELRASALELFVDYCGGGPVDIKERAKRRTR